MEKVIAVLSKKNDLSLDAFNAQVDQAYIRLVESRLGAVRFVQHVIHGEVPVTHVGGGTVQADGFSEMWFASDAKLREAVTMLSEDEFLRECSRFIDGLSWFIVSEHVVIDRQAPDEVDTVRFSPIWRRDDLSWKQFSKHWLEIHAEFTKRVPLMGRYVQNHVLESGCCAHLPIGPYFVDGFVEIRFRSDAAMKEAYSSTPAKEMFDDAKNFLGNVATYLSHTKIGGC